jgi:hypothetical protein
MLSCQPLSKKSERKIKIKNGFLYFMLQAAEIKRNQHQ